LSTTLGICSSLFVHATLSALGLSVILVQSATAYEVVKTVGALYLVYLGGRSLLQLLRKSAEPGALEQVSPALVQKSFRKSYSEGFLNNVLNPKVAIFYLAFLPQFIRPGDPVLAKSLMLAGIHAILGILWLGSLSFVLHKGRDLIQSGSLRHWLEGISGVVLIGLGVRLVFEKR
jgi:threonine/homoserine/homoserine lactone efflux protein